ncbi:inhibitor of vertebrate lysozyme family protein [Photobacterium frigidiphilum]|uniref:Ivy family c-type lysozyme inhibitor n=1 Tax=Photobacterium frigidiphilum TaxID=264736 RepID=UPI003D120A7D
MKYISIGAIFFASFSWAKPLYPWEWLEQDAFYHSYQLLLKGHRYSDWVYSLSGPASKNRVISIENKEWQVILSCKPHDCKNKNVSIFYNTKTNEMYALICDGDKTFVGHPSELIQEELFVMRGNK